MIRSLKSESNVSETATDASGTVAARSITDEQAVALLVEVVSIPSISRSERRCAEVLCCRMTEAGYRSHIDESGSVVGTLGSQHPDAAEIILLGHIDTVPGNVPVRIENGKLYGRGSVDAKGPLVAFTVAGTRIKLPAGVRLRVIGAVEEEIASSAGAHHAATMYRPMACIIGEPSGVDGITLGYKGRLLAELRITAADAHSAGPEKTAAEYACGAWLSIEAAARAVKPEATRVFDQLQARLRNISCSDDGLTCQAVLSVSFRLPPGMTAADVQRLSLSATRDLGTQHAWSFSAPELAIVSDRSNIVARALGGAIRAAGMTPRMKLKTGTADMNIVGPVWNCPIVAYGPGDSSLDHTPVEHMDLVEFLAAIKILVGALEAMAEELAAIVTP